MPALFGQHSPFAFPTPKAQIVHIRRLALAHKHAATHCFKFIRQQVPRKPLKLASWSRFISLCRFCVGPQKGEKSCSSNRLCFRHRSDLKFAISKLKFEIFQKPISSCSRLTSEHTFEQSQLQVSREMICIVLCCQFVDQIKLRVASRELTSDLSHLLRAAIGSH